MQVLEAQGSNGIFSGKGFIKVPYLNDTKLSVSFENVKINTDNQLIEGVVKTTYDPSWGKVGEVDISKEIETIRELLKNYKGTKKQRKELEKEVQSINEKIKNIDELKEISNNLETSKNNLIEKGKNFEENDLEQVSKNIDLVKQGLSEFSTKLKSMENTGGEITKITKDTYFDGNIKGVSFENNTILTENSNFKIPVPKTIKLPNDNAFIETFEIENIKIYVSSSNISDTDFEKIKNNVNNPSGFVIWLHYTKGKNELKYKINFNETYFSKKQELEIYKRIHKKMLENAQKTDNWGALIIGSAYGINKMVQKLIDTPQDFEEKAENGLEIRLLEKYYDYLYEKKNKKKFNGNILELSVNDQDALLETTFTVNNVDTDWLEEILPKEKIEEYKKMLKEFINKIDLSRLGVGIEKSVGVEVNAGIKEEASAILGNVVFLGGEDAGYVYTYYGGEAGAGGALAAGASVNAGGSLFITYNTEDKYKKHEHFAGKYNYFRGEASVGTGIVSIGGASTYSKGKDGKTNEDTWYVVSSSVSAGIGGGVSIPGSMTGGIGKIYFINPHKVDKPKTNWEKIKSYIKFVIPH